MNFPALCIALTALVLPGCSHLGLGAELLSTPLEVRRTEGGFEATVRAGLDRPANDPTWETVRRQDLAEKARAEGICPAGIEGVQRRHTALRSVESGTSYDLAYSGRCRKELPKTGAATG